MMQCMNDLHSALDVFLSPDSLLSLVETLEYSSTVTWGRGQVKQRLCSCVEKI